MIGFYIVTCDVGRDSKFNDGRVGLLGETDFVPLHEGVYPPCALCVVREDEFAAPLPVSGTFTIPFDSLTGSKNVLILPATFDPEKEGPFNLSVSMDCDFELTPAN